MQVERHGNQDMDTIHKYDIDIEGPDKPQIRRKLYTHTHIYSFLLI